MQNPLVTVCISVYNGEKYIAEALESIINQTYKNLEIIVVNDASIDNTLPILESFKMKDHRIKIINNNENKGIPYTRNVGLNEAKGKYIAIMDSDDVSMLNRIEKQVNFMENNPEISAIGANYELLGKKLRRKIKSKYYMPEEIKIKLLFSNPIANPSAMIRKSFLDKKNLKYNINYFVAQDYDLWLQISKFGKIAILPDYLIKYRVGHSNISRKSKQKMADRRKLIIDSIHKDGLEYYGFNLNEKELSVFNEFYSDNQIKKYDINFIKKILNLIETLVEINKSKCIFDKTLFEKILFESSLVALNKLKVNVGTKIKTFISIHKIFNKRLNQFELLKMSGRHLYKNIK